MNPLGKLERLSCAALLATAACSDGALVTLGEQREPVETETVFGNIRQVSFADPGIRDENPTLTDTMLEIFFESPDREEGADGHHIWYASRESSVAEFGEPRPLESFGGEGSYSSPAITLDGQTLWLAWKAEDSENDATTDLFWTARQAGDAVVFGNPEKVADELINTAEDERPRPLGDEGRVMPFSRRRVTSEGEEIWQTWFAELRADGQFEPPVLQDKLDSADVGIVDAFLSVDGLTLIFTRHAGGAGDLYWSTRRTTDDVFEGATEVPGVNTQDEERDPWLSPDGKTLFFVSNRDGELNIYWATRITRPVSD